MDYKLYQQKFADKINYFFVVDRSGSMGHPNSKFQTLKNTLQLFIANLPANARYQVISYGQHYVWLGRKRAMLELNYQNTEATKEEINGFTYSMGASNVYSPLEDIFQQNLNPGQRQRIFILTDGTVDQPTEVIELIRRKCRG